MLPGRWFRCTFVLMLAAQALGPAGRAQEASEEYELKAAFVFRFAQFVEWPAPALEGRAALEYCVWRPNPFGTVLQDLASGETLGGRPLAVRELTPSATLSTCHVLFVHGPAVPAVLDRIGRQPVLTVGDSPRFLDDGGIIQLVRAGTRVRFNVSLPAAERAGLRLSSHLLRLAATVRGGGT